MGKIADRRSGGNYMTIIDKLYAELITLQSESDALRKQAFLEHEYWTDASGRQCQRCIKWNKTKCDELYRKGSECSDKEHQILDLLQGKVYRISQDKVLVHCYDEGSCGGGRLEIYEELILPETD
jgi:hypothetical protein